MSLSVKNGGIGKSPAISRINRLSPEKETRAITEKMRRVIDVTETRALPAQNKIKQEPYNVWRPAASVGLHSYYPTIKRKANALSRHMTALVNAISGDEKT